MSPRLRYAMTTLVLVAAAVGVVAVQRGQDRPRPAARPGASAPRPPAPASPATAGEILARADALVLTAGQRARLEALDRTWRTDVEPLEAALQAATEDFSRFMGEAQAAKSARLADVQHRAADVSSLGQALRERRQAHAALAAAVLEDPQRVRLGAMANKGGGR